VTIDMKGYDGAELVCCTATVTDAQTLTVKHSDDGTTFVDVGTTDVLGDLTAFTNIASTDSNTVKSLGYVGGKRYLRVACPGAGTTGAVLSVLAVRAFPASAPGVGNNYVDNR
jgi:hypothetical protein